MSIYFDPLDISCKSITGAVRRGENLTLTIFTESEEDMAQHVELLLGKDEEPLASYPMQKDANSWTITLKIHRTGLYFYCFSLKSGYLSLGKNQKGEYRKTIGDLFQLTVYREDYRTPEWFKGGILYQIFPDRFCKVGSMPDIEGRINRSDWGGIPSYRPNEQGKVLNNDFFGGNFKGIQIKLPYLKSLNVTAIYLNPIFESASNHRYDTSDYKKIDPMLGTFDDFQELVNEANRLNIRLILDGVFNHTGDNSIYFNKYGQYPTVGAYQSESSPYASWYTFRQFPDLYDCWWGIETLPAVNEQSESYQNFIFGENGVIKTWLASGIGGYRLDVADELPDFFLKKLRKSVKESDPDAVIIGEVWEDASNKISYSTRREYLQGEELDSVMNYPLKEGIIEFITTKKAEKLSETLRILQDHYPKQTLDSLMNILGTHDTARILTVFGGKSLHIKDDMAKPNALLNEEEKAIALQKLKMATVLQYTVPGIPCIYYGDENGMEGYIDPFCRKCFDWEHLNEDLIEHYRKLGKIRTQFKEVFKDGIYRELFVEDGCMIFSRKKNRNVYVYVNNSSKSYRIVLQGTFKDFLQSTYFENELIVEPYSYGILSKSENR